MKHRLHNNNTPFRYLPKVDKEIFEKASKKNVQRIKYDSLGNEYLVFDAERTAFLFDMIYQLADFYQVPESSEDYDRLQKENMRLRAQITFLQKKIASLRTTLRKNKDTKYRPHETKYRPHETVDEVREAMKEGCTIEMSTIKNGVVVGWTKNYGACGSYLATRYRIIEKPINLWKPIPSVIALLHGHKLIVDNVVYGDLVNHDTILVTIKGTLVRK